MDNKLINFDLRTSISVLTGKFPAISEVYIFGSRRFNTESVRSDIDILIINSKRIKSSDLRDFIIDNSSALDIFILENGKALSIANESYITDISNEALIQKLQALKLFDKISGGFTNIMDEYCLLPIDRRVKHELTVLPNSPSDYFEIKALIKYFTTANKYGLPTKPYIGLDACEAADFIVTVLRNMITANDQVSNSGQAKKGWTKKLLDEYDFQNLFWITIKPWLTGMGREEVELKYDGNEKRSDFNLFNNQIVIELKHIKNDTDKRNIVKTLHGLRNFYTQHPNIRVLIFGILVNKGVELDDRKWESDFSYENDKTTVKTVIIRNA